MTTIHSSGYAKHILLLTLLTIVTVNFSHAQFLMTVKTGGLPVSSGHIGYRVGPLSLIGGLQSLRAGASYKESGTEFDWNIGAVVDFERETSVSGTLLMPFGGVKYAIPVHEDLQAYFSSIVAKPFIFTGSSGEDIGTDLESLRINLWGFQEGFGAEYFFSERFSVSGELGVNIFLGAYKEEEQIFTDFNPITGDPFTARRQESYRMNLSWTYANIGVNFYF